MASNQMKLRVVSWNCHGIEDAASHLPAGTDVALLQETAATSDSPRIENGPGPATIVNVSDRLTVEPLVLESVPVAAADRDGHPTSYPGTIAMSLVTNPDSGAQLYVVSIYVKWEKTGGWIVQETSAHRLISDLSSLITTQKHKIPILVAGDWNIVFGHGETPYWLGRYDAIEARMTALGFDRVGPFRGESGIHREAPPREPMPTPPNITPTYYTTREDPSTAWRQLDHVFVSSSIAQSVTTQALNHPAEWGPSDHCQIVIDLTL